jgi:hypothetical protein
MVTAAGSRRRRPAERAHEGGAIEEAVAALARGLGRELAGMAGSGVYGGVGAWIML